MAAVGAFTSTTATPAVTATNSSAAAGAVGVLGRATGTGPNLRTGVHGTASSATGTGVEGTGGRYGVFSNGRLGVATGKSLLCTACVNGGALHGSSVDVSKLTASAKRLQPLASGESESGGVAAAGGPMATTDYLMDGITFARPISAWESLKFASKTTDPSHCPAPDSAAPGYLCFYDQKSHAVAWNGANVWSSTGGDVFWVPTADASWAQWTYTVTAP